jgi:hypothetical protein
MDSAFAGAYWLALRPERKRCEGPPNLPGVRVFRRRRAASPLYWHMSCIDTPSESERVYGGLIHG